MSRRYLHHTTVYVLGADGAWRKPRVPHEPPSREVLLVCAGHAEPKTLGEIGDDDLAVLDHLRSTGAAEARWSLDAAGPHAGHERNLLTSIGVGAGAPTAWLRYVEDRGQVRLQCPSCLVRRNVPEDVVRALLGQWPAGMPVDINRLPGG